MRKTRIIATIGPASSDRETLLEMIQAGADGFRINFSHGSKSARETLVEESQAAIKQSTRHVSLIQDLTGPRVRTGKVKGGGSVELIESSTVQLVGGDAPCTSRRISISPDRVLDDINVGERIYIDEGLLQLETAAVGEQAIECEVISGGELKSNKGVNLPDSRLKSLPALTRKDRRDLEEGREVAYHAIMQSFVRKPEDVVALRECVEDWETDPLIIAKIETAEVLDHLEDVAREVDMMLVARGDLGAEIELEKVPGMQKKIVNVSHRFDAGVITATQMLESMVNNPIPTRAEVSDVSNAILDGTGAVMLSAETAAGSYPVRSVNRMHRIATTTEDELFPFGHEKYQIMTGWRPYLKASVKGGISMAEELNADAIGVFTRTGLTAVLTSQHRPHADILAFSDDHLLLHKLNINWGVVPIGFTYPNTLEMMFSKAMQSAVKREYLTEGDVIVFIAGTQKAVEAENLVTVREV